MQQPGASGIGHSQRSIFTFPYFMKYTGIHTFASNGNIDQCQFFHQNIIGHGHCTPQSVTLHAQK
jgi:hypothetical protein